MAKSRGGELARSAARPSGIAVGQAAAARLEQSMGGAEPGVTRPKKKVGCDASVQICYDENGPSVKLTKKYFGEEAAKRLKKQIPR